MPYGMDPINLQLFREVQRDKEIAGTAGYAEEAERALARARSLCRRAATADCDTALQKYYELRMAQKNDDESPLHEKLLRLVGKRYKLPSTVGFRQTCSGRLSCAMRKTTALESCSACRESSRCSGRRSSEMRTTTERRCRSTTPSRLGTYQFDAPYPLTFPSSRTFHVKCLCHIPVLLASTSILKQTDTMIRKIEKNQLSREDSVSHNNEGSLTH